MILVQCVSNNPITAEPISLLSRAIGPEPKLECKNKTWSVLPGDFKCVKNDGSYISEEEIFEESSYLVIITIPSVAGNFFY